MNSLGMSFPPSLYSTLLLILQIQFPYHLARGAFPSSQGHSSACCSPHCHSTSMIALTTLSNDLCAHLSHPLICQLCKLLEGGGKKKHYTLITFIMPAPSTEPASELIPHDCLSSVKANEQINAQQPPQSESGRR